MHARRLLAAVSLGIASATAAQTITLNGSMGARQALLVIDGVPRVLEIGATVQGVRLVSLAGTQAEIDVAGKRRLLVAGAGPVRVGGSGASNSSGGNEIVLTAGAGGHFRTEGKINGNAVNFVVDTGATTIAMSQIDADRIGLNYKNGRRSFASTANGSVPMHAVTLSSVRIGDVEIANVEAAVLPAAMEHVLLGNSFLTRFQMKRENDTMRLTKRPN
jgi:aspartyl protease family protein